MDWDEPHLTLSQEMQPIEWTERPTGALEAAGSLWRSSCSSAPRQRRSRKKTRFTGRRNCDGNEFLVLTESFVKAVARKKTWVVVFLHSRKKVGENRKRRPRRPAQLCRTARG